MRWITTGDDPSLDYNESFAYIFGQLGPGDHGVRVNETEQRRHRRSDAVGRTHRVDVCTIENVEVARCDPLLQSLMRREVGERVRAAFVNSVQPDAITRGRTPVPENKAATHTV